jgi:transcription antitermination factor NusG
MGYSIYSVGERVRITSGQFAGVVGVIDPPDSTRGLERICRVSSAIVASEVS